jgi:ribosome maturation factor RimP
MEGEDRQGGLLLEDRVRHMVEEVIQDTPVFLVDLSIRGRKGSQILDIFVESDEVLDVKELARISREVGFLLDTEDVMPGRYSLNVSSPGLDRPLKLPRQFRKNVKRTLRVKYNTGADGETATLEGELTGTDEQGIEVSPSKDAPVRIAYTDIVEAKVKLPW